MLIKFKSETYIHPKEGYRFAVNEDVHEFKVSSIGDFNACIPEGDFGKFCPPGGEREYALTSVFHAIFEDEIKHLNKIRSLLCEIEGSQNPLTRGQAHRSILTHIHALEDALIDAPIGKILEEEKK